MPVHAPGHPAAFTDPAPRVTVSGVDFKDTYSAERSKMMTFLMSVGADQHEADDAVQDAFADAYAAWDTIREPRPWLYKAALRAYYRGSSRARNRETPAGDRLPDQAEPLNSGDIAVLNDEEQTVQNALAGLPAKQRQVMALTLAGFTAAEIGQLLSSDPAAVRQNQVRARDNLARQLGISRRTPR